MDRNKQSVLEGFEDSPDGDVLIDDPDRIEHDGSQN
jgi:hypothetical protein